MSATDINDWPGHPDADPDCECCLGDGLQADGETPCPRIDARKGYHAVPESPDRYRREGAEAMRAACVRAVNATASPIVGTPYSAGGRAFADAIRAIDVDDVLARLTPAPDAVARLEGDGK